MNGAENEVVAVKGDEVMNADVVVPVQTDERVVVQEEDQVGMTREETETEDEDLGVAVMIGLFNWLDSSISSKMFFLEVQ